MKKEASHSWLSQSLEVARKPVSIVAAGVAFFIAAARTEMGQRILEGTSDLYLASTADAPVTTEEDARHEAWAWMNRRSGLSDLDTDESGIDPVDRQMTNFDDTVREELKKMIDRERLTPEQEIAVTLASRSLMEEPKRTELQTQTIEAYIERSMPKDKQGHRTMGVLTYKDSLGENMKHVHLSDAIYKFLQTAANKVEFNTVSDLHE